MASSTSVLPAPAGEVRALALGLVVTTAIAVVGALVLSPYPSAEVWGRLTPGDCAEYCEASAHCGALARRAVIQQPANSWSNLAFVLVGFVALFRRLTPRSVTFALACCVLGIGSFLFHATVTRELQWLDVVGMYVALGAVAARGLHDAWGLRWSRVLPAYLGWSSLLTIFKWQLDTTIAMVALGFVVAWAMARRMRAGAGSLAAALLPLGLIGIGYGVRALDVSRAWCDPASWLQGHALWHLLSAASLYTAWRFFDASGKASA